MRKSGKSRSGISKRKGWVSCRNHIQDSQKSLPLHSRRGEKSVATSKNIFQLRKVLGHVGGAGERQNEWGVGGEGSM